MIEYKIGMFGYFKFDIFKKDKFGEYTTEMSGHYEIIDIDRKNIELSDGQRTLRVTKRRIKKFELKKKPDK
jgi:hypothetical protein